MRKPKLSFLFIVVIVLPLYLFSPASATQSRLSAMGDLSIVIEDESNRIDLWDFSGNPAGFLEDESGNVIRSDFLWEPYRAWDIKGPNASSNPQFGLESTGNTFQALVSSEIRRKSNYAIGITGSFSRRKANFNTADYELSHPDLFLVFSKQLNPKTSLGADLTYVEYTSKTKSKSSQTTTRSKTHYFRTQIGGQRSLSNEILLAILFGYDSIDSGKKFYTSDYYTFWASLESIIQINKQLKLGLELASFLRRDNYESGVAGETQKYYFSTFKLKGIYNLTAKLQLGLFYADNEITTTLFHPLESFIYPISPDGLAVSHYGLGGSYQITEDILAGTEFHFRNSSYPHSSRPDWGLFQASWNTGIEYTISEPLVTRVGYIRTWTDRNPIAGLRTRCWTKEDAITFGIGCESKQAGLIIDFSYRYSYKKFAQWYIDWNVKSKTHLLSLSLKKSF